MRKELRKRLIEAIDMDGYGDRYAPTLKGLKEVMIDEFFSPQEMYRAKGRLSVLASEWFRGLPSAVAFSALGNSETKPFYESMPYLYGGTNALMVECGYDVEGMDEVEIDDLYWSELGEILVEG